MKAARATAPARIDLAGGTLDIWPLYLFHPGAVTINVAIDRLAETTIEPRAGGLVLESVDTAQRHEVDSAGALAGPPGAPLAAYVLAALGLEKGCRVTTESRVPAGSGLGGSSALAVTIAAAACGALGRAFSEDELWPIVRDAEAQCIGVPTGIQDYLAALRGGVLAIHLGPGRIRVERLGIDPARVEECLVLADAGVSRFSGINNWEVFKARIDGEARVRESLAAIATVAVLVRQALVEGRLDDVTPLIAEEWEARKRLAPAVTSPEVDRIVAAALSVGAAAKVCGAGGGGTVAAWAPPPRRERVTEAIRAEGFRVLDFRVARSGLALEEPA